MAESKKVFASHEFEMLRGAVEAEIRSLTLSAAKAKRPQFREVYDAEKRALQSLLARIEEVKNG